MKQGTRLEVRYCGECEKAIPFINSNGKVSHKYDYKRKETCSIQCASLRQNRIRSSNNIYVYQAIDFFILGMVHKIKGAL
mgnify:CR=1 FL=1|tara:strand:- start:208 stop:447 length:240 start_codon:yes stop_codon:yes gene_type:complete